MGPTTIDRMDDRMDAVEAALTNTMPNRIIKRALVRAYDDHDEGQIEKGVIMLLSGGEDNYKQGPGMVAKEGTHRMILICHVKAEHNDNMEAMSRAVEKTETTLAEEIKNFVRTGITGVKMELERLELSRQVDAPFGFVVAYIDAGAPRQTTH